MLRFIAALSLIPSLAFAQIVPSYIVYPDLPTCQARSQQQAIAMGTDQVDTIYWWDCTQLTDGTAAMRIEAAGNFGSSPSNAVTQGLVANPNTTLTQSVGKLAGKVGGGAIAPAPPPTSGLTAAEQAQLKPQSAIQALLPAAQ